MSDDLTFESDGWLQRLFVGSQHRQYRLVVWCFALGSFAHLWLADAWQADWLVANLFYAVGLLLLVTTRSAAGWILCAVGLVIPLFFLRDQLTQSVILLLWSCCGAIAMFFRSKIDARAEHALFAVFRIITALTYGFATLHKINRDFLEPDTSCAVYGVDELWVYYGLGELNIGPLLDAVPFAALVLEGGICVAFLLGRHRIAWLLAPLFHLPITLTMAPAFAFVMLPGYLAFMTDEDREHLRAEWKQSGIKIIPIAACLLAASLVAHGSLPEITMIPKEGLIWILLLFVWKTFHPFQRGDRSPFRKFRHDLPQGRWRILPAAAGVIFVVNCLTPYTGLQYQHAAAMLSNLRIDQGCWNSYVFPESVRLREDYIRIDRAYFKEPGFLTEYENIAKEQLWSPPQIRQMRRNWCKESLRPIYLEAKFRGELFVIEDLCEPDPLPFTSSGFFGVELFPDALRFQKNLMRECPQACIH